MTTCKIKIGGKMVKILLIIIVTLLIMLVIKLGDNKTAFNYNYKGRNFLFRAKLSDALKVSVYPSDKALLDAVMNEEVKQIYIAFVNSSDNNLVAVNGFEVSNKLATIFYLNDVQKTIKGLLVQDYNLTGTDDSLFIAMIPPALANKTEVRLENNVVFISAETKKDFDLATVRFLMAIMEVVV